MVNVEELTFLNTTKKFSYFLKRKEFISGLFYGMDVINSNNNK